MRPFTQSTARPPRLSVEALEDRTQPSAYTVADLGTLGGEYSEGYGLNDRGQVAGIADTAEVTPDGFSVNRPPCGTAAVGLRPTSAPSAARSASPAASAPPARSPACPRRPTPTRSPRAH
jgi:hypothetical protein